MIGMNAEEKRNKKVQLWLSQSEYDRLKTSSQESNCRNFSAYLRSCVFQKPIVSSYRNASIDDAMVTIGHLLHTLYCISDRQDLAIKQLNEIWRFEEYQTWQSEYKKDMQRLWDAVDRIEGNIEKMAKLWLE